jgi:hypothetical protein
VIPDLVILALRWANGLLVYSRAVPLAREKRGKQVTYTWMTVTHYLSHCDFLNINARKTTLAYGRVGRCDRRCSE